MLDKGIRILNFDDSITAQRKLFYTYLTEIIDFTSLATSARLFMSAAIRKKILNTLSKDGKNYPVFLGSGDFHHLSEILTSRINEPACLIIFDFHPDWETCSPRFSCGSWVNQALKNKNILKCIHIGAGSDDLSFPALQSAGLNLLKKDRLQIYPYRHNPSRVFCRSIAQNTSITTKKNLFSNEITWNQLEGKDLAVFAAELVKRLPSNKVYISIDKDCLTKDYALTNWEEGFLSLEQLLTVLRILRQNLDIIGIDITGDYSASKKTKSIKAFVSNLDHPKKPSAFGLPQDVILSVNEQANLSILQEIFS